MPATGLIGHKEVTDGLLGAIRGYENHLLKDIQDVALTAAIDGEQAAHDTIDNTPSGLRPGKPNRNWTFKMNQSLDSKVERRGNTITLRAGWLNIKEGYFLLQEEGFTKGAVTVAPMHALQAAHTAMLRTLTLNGLKAQ
jgi:hypothetical protein